MSKDGGGRACRRFATQLGGQTRGRRQACERISPGAEPFLPNRTLGPGTKRHSLARRNDLVHGDVVRIAIAGASGFVGRGFVEALVSRHDDVIGLSRHRLDLPGVEGHEVDVADEGALRKVLTRCEAGFYLVHSLGARDFRAHDRRLAEGFGRAAAAAGVQRIVYLGGLGRTQSRSTWLAAKRSAGRSARAAFRSSNYVPRWCSAQEASRSRCFAISPSGCRS